MGKKNKIVAKETKNLVLKNKRQTVMDFLFVNVMARLQSNILRQVLAMDVPYYGLVVKFLLDYYRHYLFFAAAICLVLFLGTVAFIIREPRTALRFISYLARFSVVYVLVYLLHWIGCVCLVWIYANCVTYSNKNRTLIVNLSSLYLGASILTAALTALWACPKRKTKE